MNRRATRFHGFTLDADRRLVAHGGHVLHLTRTAFDLLALLLDRAPAVVTKDELHRLRWPGTFVTDSTVAGVIKELRRERRVRLDDGVTELGREPGIAVWIDSPVVSRRHARIVLASAMAVIEDLDSKNGTQLNDHPVAAATPLHDGDVVQIGPARFVFRVAHPAASTAIAANCHSDGAS